MKRIIAALQMTLDGRIEGPEGELDWVGTWDEDFELMEKVDTCVLGGGMWPGYEQYWTSILADPRAPLALTGQRPTHDEIEYATWADRTPHVVLSTTAPPPVWSTARVVRSIDDIRALKDGDGKDIYAVGGATFVSNLLDEGLIDELRLVVHPLVLGPGASLFKDVKARHRLELVSATPSAQGHLSLVYRLG